MTWKTIAATLFAGALIAPAAQAQKLSPELQAIDAQLPGTLINDPTRLDWAVQGANVKSEGVTDPAVTGGVARRFEVAAASPEAWEVQALVPLLGDIQRGETVTIGFWARATDAATTDGMGELGIRFQQNREPWPGFGDTTLRLGPEWKWHEVSAVSNIRIPRRDAIVTLQLGSARQTVEIGQTIVVKGAAQIAGGGPTQVELPPPLQDVRGSLINRPERRGWAHFGSAGAAELERQSIWLEKATRFTVTAKGENRWDAGTTIPLEEAIAEGDRLLIAIAARTENAQTADGNAAVGIRVQSSEPPFDGFADNMFKVGPRWQLIQLRTTAPQGIPAGKATVTLHFAEAPQVVDIGPVYVFRLEE